MSHDESQNQPPAAPEPPAAPAPEPPAAPAAPPPATPAADGGKSDSDRLSALESITANLAESMTAFMDAIKGGSEQEHQPQSVPWTHRGGHKK